MTDPLNRAGLLQGSFMRDGFSTLCYARRNGVMDAYETQVTGEENT